MDDKGKNDEADTAQDSRAPTVSKQSMVSAVMTDASLSAQERQQRIQEIMKGNTSPAAADSAHEGTTGVSTVAQAVSSSSDALSSTSQALDATNLDARSLKVGASMSKGADPARSKGARSSTLVDSSVASVVNGDIQEPLSVSSVGASVGTGVDPASRKGARASSRRANTTVSNPVAGLEPEVMPPTSSAVGAVANTGTDLSAGKMSASSRRIQRSSRESTRDSLNVGASVGSRHDDPSARKAARSTRAANRASGLVGSAQQSIATTVVHRNVYVGDVEDTVPQNDDAVSTAAVAAPAAGAAVRPTTPICEDQQPPAVFETQHQVVQSDEREMYAGVGLTGPDIAGADIGGIQAYVAGDDKPVVIEAAAVVTEEELEAEDERKMSRKLKIGAALGCLVLVAIVVPVAILVPGGGEDKVFNTTSSPTSAPSSTPTTSTFAELLSAIEPLYPDSDSFEVAFSDIESPQFKAADWATNVANLGLSGDDPRMISRYALAAFYYSTNGDSWVRCGQESTSCAEEQEWLTGEDECNWFSIACQDSAGRGDHIISSIQFRRVDEDNSSIDGTLPFEMTFLSALERFSLPFGGLKGSLPSTWSRMTSLRDLLIASNGLTGSFPDFLFGPNSRLETLYLRGNNLTGTIPTFSSATLKALRIEENSFTGPIPESLGGLQALTEFRAQDNDFSSAIPVNLFNLPGLKELDLTNNTRLSGSLPDAITASLEHIRLVNTGLGGPLPPRLFDLSNLQTLDFGRSSFSGTLSVEFTNLSNVTRIGLNNNTFSGPIPDVFQQLDFLRSLELHGNSLTGSVSQALCDQTGDGFFDINLLTTDCLDKVTCNCCDECY